MIYRQRINTEVGTLLLIMSPNGVTWITIDILSIRLNKRFQGLSNKDIVKKFINIYKRIVK